MSSRRSRSASRRPENSSTSRGSRDEHVDELEAGRSGPSGRRARRRTSPSRWSGCRRAASRRRRCGSTVDAIDSIGVMPDPAAMHRWRPPSRAPGRGRTAARRLHLDWSPGATSRTSQRENSPSGTSRTPTRGRARPARRSSTSGVFAAVDDPPQRERLARPEGELVGQLVGHVEGHGGRVVGEPLDVGDGERVEGGGRHQISFTCSNGSRQGGSGRAPCRRWRRTPRSAPSRRPAARAVQLAPESAAGSSGTGPRAAARGRARQAVLAQRLPGRAG